MARLTPVFVMVLALGGLSLMDALVKMLGASYPVWQITFLRYAFGLTVALLLIPLARPAWPDAQTIRANMLRGILVLAAAASFFHTVQYLPLALATTLFFLAPLFTVALGGLLLGEPVTRSALVALGLGLAGVVVIAGGSLATDQLDGTLTENAIGFALGILTAICYSTAIVTIRVRAQKDDKVSMAVLQSLGAVILVTPLGLATWEPVATADLGLFLAVGTCGTMGFLAISYALSLAPVTRIAPLEYAAFLWASLWGFLFFGETPRLPTILGGALIVIAGLIVIRQESAVAMTEEETPPV
ncbi:DMT family transporter [Rhodobium gokarnense]|uniref:S-adenosylmethionine uptake transporter n=1 Tax=Rhodobium gokarnense TaxID=364296 RepID=A0ABT3HCL5_9HYPH|nr:DMT family transporter [Rhodobium gokarnense]MCW2308148.1 S-adenosylmethionine uptake transporter [Rhodobium gokarnense]